MTCSDLFQIFKNKPYYNKLSYEYSRQRDWLYRNNQDKTYMSFEEFCLSGEYKLEDSTRWIRASILWCRTKEGFEYWHDIAKQWDNYVLIINTLTNMTTSTDFKVVFKHPFLGEFATPATMDDNKILHIEHAQITNWLPKETCNLDLHYLIEHDLEKFRQMSDDAVAAENKISADERANKNSHYINVESMKVHYVEIAGSFLRVHYVFDQFSNDEHWRMCAGEYTTIYTNANSGVIKNAVMNRGYSNDCVVYW